MNELAKKISLSEIQNKLQDYMKILRNSVKNKNNELLDTSIYFRATRNFKFKNSNIY